MSSGDSSAPHFVELLVTDSMYNVIIDNNAEVSICSLSACLYIKGKKRSWSFLIEKYAE